MRSSPRSVSHDDAFKNIRACVKRVRVRAEAEGCVDCSRALSIPPQSIISFLPGPFQKEERGHEKKSKKRENGENKTRAGRRSHLDAEPILGETHPPFPRTLVSAPAASARCSCPEASFVSAILATATLSAVHTVRIKKKNNVWWLAGHCNPRVFCFFCFFFRASPPLPRNHTTRELKRGNSDESVTRRRVHASSRRRATKALTRLPT